MGSRREQALIAALVVAMAVLVLLAAPDDVGDSLDPRASTFRAAPPGTLALYLTLEELGVPIERRLESWIDGPPLEGVLVLLAPSRPISPLEVGRLVEWVEAGGTLVLAGGWYVDHGLLASVGLVLTPLLGEPETAVAGPAHPWMLEPAGVAGFGWTFSDESAALARGDAQPLLRTADGDVVLVVLRLGAGHVVAWSDVGPLTNAELRDGGGALVFARAAADLARAHGPLVFDEYHHGYRAGVGPGRATLMFLVETGPGRMALQLAVAALGLLWLYGRRFGAPLPPAPAHRRSPLEHVEALAGAYRQGGARQTACRLIVAGLARRLGVPAPPAGTEDAWLQRLAARATPARPHAEALLEQWRRAASADLAVLARHADAVAAEERG